MARWRKRIELGDVFHDDGLTFEQRRDVIAARVRGAGWLTFATDVGGLEFLLDELAGAADADEFDAVWDEVYDLADEDRVWINTFGTVSRG